MEKYEEIYNYLQTFPADTTVGTLIANMDKAEEEFFENQKKMIADIKAEFVGNTYFFEERDDEKSICKYITYVKEFNENSIKDMSFTCDLISITQTYFHVEENVCVDLKGLKMAKKVNKELFDNAMEKFNTLKAFSV